MTKSKQARGPCANEGCRRPAQESDTYCETCAIERSLYRREDRTPRSRVSAVVAR
jgi:hypothetical protein